MFSTFKEKEENCCSTTTQNCSANTDTDTENCCTPQAKVKMVCPACEENANGVLEKTLESLLTDEAKSRLSALDGFYYCKTPSCQTVYFKDEIILTQKDIRVIVGLKDDANPATVCYCFDWTKEKIKAEIQTSGESYALEDIKAKMQDPGCSCEILNPSGACCLGDVNKVIKAIKN